MNYKLTSSNRAVAMHFGLSFEALSLSELCALRFDSIHLLLLVADLVADSTRTDSVLDALLRAINWAAVMPVVVAGARWVTCAGSSVLGRVALWPIVSARSTRRDCL